MLAYAVKSQLEGANVPWVGSDLEVDIADAASVRKFSAAGQFTHVINCAAFTNVDSAEEQSAAAHRVNAEGPKNLWSACKALKATLLHFSTDYVFSGNAAVPYKETDTPAPLGVYGASKLCGEQAVLGTAADGAHCYVIRTSWLYGPHGKNFVATMLRLMAEREHLSVVSDQYGRPTYTLDLAAASLKLAGLISEKAPAKPGIYHFANSGQTSWHGFAGEVLRAAQAASVVTTTKSVRAISTAEFPTLAERPAFSVLDTQAIENALGEPPRAWQATLTDYLKWFKTSY